GRGGQPQAVHPAVDGEHRPGGGTGQRAGQVGDGGGDLLGGDQPAAGLAGPQRLELGLGVGGRGQQPADPGGVGRSRVDTADADALGQVVGGHRQGQRLHGALGGAVQGAVGEADGGGDRAGVDHHRGGRGAQVGQGGAGDPDD